MRSLIFAFLIGLALLGCTPEYPGFCEYCHVNRQPVWNLSCITCSKYHTTCGAEAGLWVNTPTPSEWKRITVCPKPQVIETK